MRVCLLDGQQLLLECLCCGELYFPAVPVLELVSQPLEGFLDFPLFVLALAEHALIGLVEPLLLVSELVVLLLLVLADLQLHVLLV